MVVTSNDDDALTEAACKALASELQRVKWLGDRTLSLAAKHQWLGLRRAEVIQALADLSTSVLDHQLLSRGHVYNMLLDDSGDVHRFSSELADLFLARFDPAAPQV